MAVQDLTPQLRTRLGRVERVVGWFVILATLLLLAGFGYYVYSVAQRKGWLKAKVPYFTYVRDAQNLRVGDPIRLMGFDVGQITDIQPEAAENQWARENGYNVFIQFVVQAPYYGYILTDSKLRVASADLLGKRVLEVSRGVTGLVTVIEREPGKPTRVLNQKSLDRVKAGGEPDYLELTKQFKGYWIPAEESPALGDRLEQLANQIQSALPGILNLTNQITGVLSNAASLTANLNDTTTRLRPAIQNLNYLSAQLTNGPGALGEWLLPTNLNQQLVATLGTANQTLLTAGTTMTNASTNVVMLAQSLNLTLLNLANITSNLNQQVQSNDQMLSQISSAVTNADNLVQGLKRHWLLRSAFKDQNAPPASPADHSEPGRNRPPLKAGKWR